MSKTKAGPRKSGGGQGSVSGVTVLYNDAVRKLQVARFKRLQIQVCMAEAKALRAQIDAQIARLAVGGRPEVPSARLLALSLGLFRTGATLKQDAMQVLELSVAEIAEILGYRVTQVKLVLAWLGHGFVMRAGKAVAKGLGIVACAVRFGKIAVEGVVKSVYRTAKRGLSDLGRQLLGLLRDNDSVPPKSAQTPRNETEAAREARTARREKRHSDRAKALHTVRNTVTDFFGAEPEPERQPLEEAFASAEEAFMRYEDPAAAAVARWYLRLGRKETKCT